MRKWILGALALVAVAIMPTDAVAQGFTTQAEETPGACSYCELCPSIIEHWHHEATHGDTVLEHAGCVRSVRGAYAL